MNAFWAEIPIRVTRNLVAISCAAILVPGDLSSLARPMLPQAAAATEEAARVPPEQLDSLVAPIALYPDPMLSQTLVASTYPLEIIQLQQWLEKNKSLKDKALADAVKKQDWDPSIQAMAALPEVVKQMAENIKWTTDLGNAFLAQQGDVMDAVQRMIDHGGLMPTDPGSRIRRGAPKTSERVGCQAHKSTEDSHWDWHWHFGTGRRGGVDRYLLQ